MWKWTCSIFTLDDGCTDCTSVILQSRVWTKHVRFIDWNWKEKVLGFHSHCFHQTSAFDWSYNDHHCSYLILPSFPNLSHLWGQSNGLNRLQVVLWDAVTSVYLPPKKKELDWSECHQVMSLSIYLLWIYFPFFEEYEMMVPNNVT